MAIQEATPIRLSARERAVLETWARAQRDAPRQAERARIVLLAADGIGTRRIAQAVGCTIGTASKWRVRFASSRLDGLADRPRPGAVPRYDDATDRRILALLDTPPPEGRRMWTGALLSHALGDVSDQYIWRFLRRRGIGQGDRRTWHLNVGAPFRGRTVDIVALYLHPLECAMLLSAHRGPPAAGGVGEDGYVRIPRGAVPAGLGADGGERSGSALLAALNAAGRGPERRTYADPAFSLSRLIATTAEDFADRRVVVVAEGAEAAAVAAARRNVSVTRVAGREAWLSQLAVSLSLLVGSENDPSARLRAAELAAAARRFLDRADRRGAPFIWGRKSAGISDA